MKKTLITLTIIIVAILAYGIYNKLQPVEQTDPYEAKIQAIMEEPLFQETMKNEAKRIYTQRKKEEIELKAKEELKAIEKEFELIRKKELELIASSSPVILKE